MNLGKVAFIFSGGGFSGAYSVGLARAVLAKGIRPDFVQGVSVGALNGAKLVETNFDIEALAQVWHRVQQLGPGSVFDFHEWFSWKNALMHPREILRKLLHNTFLSDNKKLLNFLIKDLNFEAIVNSPVEFQVVVTNGKTFQREVISNRDERVKRDPAFLGQAILASAALPLFLPRANIDGTPYCDGNVFKISEAIRRKCDTIFVFMNSQFKPDGENHENMIWWEQGIFIQQLLGIQLAISKIEYAVECGYTLIQNNPAPMLDNIKPFRKFRRIGQRIQKYAGDLAGALTGAIEDPEIMTTKAIFVPRRLPVLTPTKTVPTLTTIKFRANDIEQADKPNSELNEEFWEKF